MTNREVKQLQDFAIWMTGCGYDFTKHKHYMENKYLFTKTIKTKPNYYKAIQNNKFYLAINRFPGTAKNDSKAYLTGIRIWDSDDMKMYSIVFGCCRLMFGVKKPNHTCQSSL